MSFNIETYLNSLSENTMIIDVSNRELKYLPSLKRFRILKRLYCDNNQLTTLPELNENLKQLHCGGNYLTTLPKLNKNLRQLYCYNNYLTILPKLNENLKKLDCCNNELTSLPELNENLEQLFCYSNRLTYLPKLNKNIYILYCFDNRLTSLPELNDKLLHFRCYNNPINEIIYLEMTTMQTINEKRQQIKTFNQFKHLFYSLKFKRQFRDWLWLKVREPKIMFKFHPSCLLEIIENLEDKDVDFDKILNNL